MYKSKFSIDGDEDPENIVEGYTDGTLWNGWANVCFTREQVSAWLDASPYDYRFLEANTTMNKRDYPVLLIYFDDREEIIESSGIFYGGVLFCGYKQRLISLIFKGVFV